MLAIYREMGDQETTEIVREDEKYETESERACRGEKMDQGGIRKNPWLQIDTQREIDEKMR
jgi:hypothetical protein